MKNALSLPSDHELDARPSDQESLKERWRVAMDDITRDAQGRAESYPAQSLVPEGGE